MAKIEKINVAMTKEEWKLVLEEIDCGIACAEEDMNLFRIGFLENIRGYIERAIKESEE